MTKAIIDLETWTPSVMSNTTGGIHPWQKDALNNLYGGIARGEMSIISSGRQSGKSYYQQLLAEYFHEFRSPAYEQVSSELVDGERWMTVKCNKETAAWVREQNKKYVYEHSGSYQSLFDIHEKLYTMLKIRFTPNGI